MDYKIEKFNRWDYIVILILLLVILPKWEINLTNISNKENITFFGILVALLGVSIMVILWIIDYIREKDFDEKIISRLGYELRTNLAVIVDNIHIIENKLSPSNLGGIFDEVFISLINSHKIVIIPKDALDHLFCFYTEAKNINKALKRKDFKATLKRLKSGKYWLEKVFTKLGQEQWYKENQLIGIRYKPIKDKEKIPLSDDKKGK